MKKYDHVLIVAALMLAFFLCYQRCSEYRLNRSENWCRACQSNQWLIDIAICQAFIEETNPAVWAKLCWQATSADIPECYLRDARTLRCPAMPYQPYYLSNTHVFCPARLKNPKEYGTHRLE